MTWNRMQDGEIILSNASAQAAFEVAAPFFSAENQARLLAAKERMDSMGGTIHEPIEADLL